MTRESRIEAWRELVSFLLSPSATIEEVADAAYRISWYVGGVEDEQLECLYNALEVATDRDLARFLGAAAHAEGIDGSYADHVVYIIGHLPNAVKRVVSAIEANRLPRTDVSTAIAVVECLEERDRPDLWGKYGQKADE